MIIKKQDIINLPVYTQSSRHLGKVVDFEISTESHRIEKYVVRSSLNIAGILKEDLLISADQVVSITKDKMVVEDTLTTEQSVKKAVPAV